MPIYTKTNKTNSNTGMSKSFQLKYTHTFFFKLLMWPVAQYNCIPVYCNLWQKTTKKTDLNLVKRNHNLTWNQGSGVVKYKVYTVLLSLAL